MNKYIILLLMFCAMCVQTALASAQLSSASLARYNAAQFPEASMQSTSALLNSSAPQMNYKQVSVRRNTSGAQMSFRAMRTTSAAQVQTIGVQGNSMSAVNLSSGTSYSHTYSASSAGTAGMSSISLPALSITEKNIASAGYASVAEEEENYGLTPRPRRVDGEDGGDNPNEPYIDAPYTSVGATPWLLFVLLSGLYVAFRLRSRKPQPEKSI